MAARPFDAEMSILRLVDDDERMDVFVADFLSHKNRDRMGTIASYSYPHRHSSTIVHLFVCIKHMFISRYRNCHKQQITSKTVRLLTSEAFQ